MLFKRRKDDEEVCFICFDGGELVVCDRRGCPKVYHPSCVNRDEAFFRAKGQWNCGWHICSNCEKKAKYMCYTCTFSLCKGCLNEEAGLVLVRGDKGFCLTCMSTVMMIESNGKGNKIPGDIDFDDKTCWMSFFKDYWLSLKAKLSLTLEELVRAKTPQIASNEVSHHEYSDDSYANNVHEASSDSSSRHLEGNRSSKKTKKRSRDIDNEESSVRETESLGTSVSENNDWASQELMEFVGHMKAGDKSALSQFDVQNMLLEYIKQNNLRDPRKKGTIICDSRLQNLFGKMRVGHFEMLKLLELHFPMEHSPVATDDNQEGVVDPDPSQIDTEGTSDASTMMTSDRKRRRHKRLEKDLQIDLDDYAAIDAHNINLIYLRRNLMEELIDHVDTFSEKVVGTFVRIRIAGAGQRLDIYRLVQVVGTGKAAKKYKTGKKTTDFTLEILNLNKTEFITIDNISNQEFTEEECKRLKQSIKCGFIGRLSVGEVQEKARVLQSARVKDWFESEKLRLSNLRDRASEQGRRKQLRECVEKLQLLSTPEERIRKLNEVPEIHVDVKMDPDYESSENDEEMEERKQVLEDHDHTRESYIHVNGTDGISPGKGGSVSNNNWIGKQSSLKIAWQNRETPALSSLDVGSSTSASSRITKSGINREKEVQLSCDSEPMSNQTNVKYSEVGANNNNHVLNPRESSVRSEPASGSPSPEVIAKSNVSETEKMWHYKDPSGKIQGPFSVTQLRKWNSTGYFPESLRIWRATESQEDSILLADALIGKFQKDLPKLEHQCNSSAQPLAVATSDSREGTSGNAFRQNNCSISTNSNQNATSWRSSQPDTCVSGAGNNESVRGDMRAAYPSSQSAPKSEMINQKERVGGWQSSNTNNAWSGQSQVPNTSRPNTAGNHYHPPQYQSRGGRSRWNGGQDRHGNWNSSKSRGVQPGGQGYGRQHPNWNQHPSGGQWNNQNVNNASNQSRNNPIIPPTLLPNNMGWATAQGAFINSSPSPSPVQVTSSVWGTAQRITETGKSLILATDSNITADARSSVQGWNSGSALNVPTQNITADASKSFFIPSTAPIAGTVGVQSSQLKDYSGHPQMPDEQKKSLEFSAPMISVGPQLPRHNEKTTLNSTLASNGPGSTTELRSDSEKIQSLEVSRRNPDPRCEQRAGDVRSPSLPTETQNPVAPCNERDFHKNCSATENITTASVAVLEPSTGTLKRESNSKVDAVPSEAGQSSNVQHFGPTHSKPPTLPDALEPASDQGSEAFTSMKQGSAVLSDNLASAANVGENETNRSSRPETSISGPVRGDSGNLSETNRSVGTIPTPSATTRTSTWDASPNPTRGNSQNVPLIPTTSQPPPSPWKMNTSTELAQTSAGGLAVAPQNSSMVVGPSQANSNVAWATAVPGTANTGWGVVMQGNTNVVWGIPAQGNPNLTIGYGTPVQTNADASMGWGTVAQGGMNVNQAWGTPPQGNTTTNVGWAVPAQGNAATNLTWGQLNTNSAPVCPVPTQVSVNQNFGWGTPVTGNANINSGLLAGQGNVNQPWNPNDLSNQQNRIRDGHNSGHDARRPSWNTMQPNVGEGSSRSTWEQSGICKFHETGHCKKGAYCSFIHP